METLKKIVENLELYMFPHGATYVLIDS